MIISFVGGRSLKKSLAAQMALCATLFGAVLAPNLPLKQRLLASRPS